MRRYMMKKWINEKIPILGGKSPKECVKEKKNTQLLITMIKEGENADDRAGDYDPKENYATLLGIDHAHHVG